jgi:hypothetical protein
MFFVVNGEAVTWDVAVVHDGGHILPRVAVAALFVHKSSHSLLAFRLPLGRVSAQTTHGFHMLLQFHYYEKVIETNHCCHNN